ncbi:hypothetical protein Q0F98_21495 [Paenibacillus amylolyticus]|nr:hypothetical protein Q0F98_21495 [Paenibacillus amylolyticus]
MSKKILIADDNSEIREIVRILLESENYEVIEAIDGQDAIDKVNGRDGSHYFGYDDAQ